MRSFQEMIFPKSPKDRSRSRIVSVESRQFDAVGTHDPNAAKLEAFGEIEDGSTLRQHREGCVRRQLGRADGKDIRDPGGRDLATDVGIACDKSRRKLDDSAMAERWSADADDAIGRLSDHRAVLLINERSNRPAVQIPAPSFMLDDGEIEKRVRLIRPMEQHSVPLEVMAESHWVEVDRGRFSTAWLAELAEVPEFSESTIHIVAGLLLPIWKRLPNESTRVYRLQTDAGERIDRSNPVVTSAG